MKNFILIILCVLVSKTSFSQSSWVWANSANGGSQPGLGASTAYHGKPTVLDGGGNIYITGGFIQNLNFGGTMTLTGSTPESFFLAKYAPSGALIWANTATTNSNNTRGAAVTIDTAGHIVVVGTTTADTLTFGSYTITRPQSSLSGSYMGFIVKYSPTGTVLMASIVSSNTRPFAVDNDLDGNLYIAGSYFNAPTLGTFTLPNATLGDVFIAKYNPAGIVQWVTTGGSAGYDLLTDMVVNNNGEAFILGKYNGTMTIGGNTLPNSGLNMFLAKISSSGSLQWISSPTPSTSMVVAPNHLASDPIGNLYVSGHFYDGATPLLTFGSNVSVSYDPAWWGDPNSFIVKYNANGVALWASSVAGQNRAHSSAPDPSGIVYVSGNFQNDTIWFGSNFLVKSPLNQPLNKSDGYVAKYDTSGNFLSALSTTGYSSVTHAWTLLSDNVGGFYAAGTYAGVSGSSAIAISLGNQNLPNGTGLFVARYGVCTTPPPQPGSITGLSTLCSGKSYTYSIPAVTGAAFYTWSLPSGWIGASTSNAITAVAASNGNITVAANNTCGGSVAATKAVVVNPTPNPVITQSGLQLSTPAGQGSYQWYLNNFPITSATFNTHLVTANGAYYVRVTNSTGCFDTSNTIMVTQVNVKDAILSELAVYPQPNNGHFSIRLKNGLRTTDIRLTNLYGAEVEKRIIINGDTVEVELLNKVAGLYFLSVYTASNQFVTKILVE